MRNWLSQVDTSTVLWGQMIIYTIYCLAIISVVLFVATKLTTTKTKFNISNKLFYGWVIFLVALGVSLHLVTLNTIPWVKADLFGGTVTRTYNVTVANHKFTFADPLPLQITCNQLVEFDVRSPLAPKGAPEPALTYGFGVFQQITKSDGSKIQGPMITQMQVVPGNYSNNLRWSFVRNGTYMVRSTEYSGPAQMDGWNDKLVVPDAIVVTGCSK